MNETNSLNFLFSLNSLFITFLLIIQNINLSLCATCAKDTLISDTKCFNNVLKFDSKKYRAGHFVTYKNGDMIAEFSDDGALGDNTVGYSRIFYGLKENGRYYFPDESPIWEIQNIGKIDNARGRYESLNLLVVKEDDLTRENEFLFSTSSYDSLTELHIISNKTYTYAKTTSFVGKEIYSFQYPMVEVKYNDKIFYFIGITFVRLTDRHGDSIYIKKFGFNSFSLSDINTYNSKTLTLEDNYDNRIFHMFAIEEFESLIVFYLKKTNNDIYLIFKSYDYDLGLHGGENNIDKITIVANDNSKGEEKDGVFFKSVGLPGNKRGFAYYKRLSIF